MAHHVPRLSRIRAHMDKRKKRLRINSLLLALLLSPPAALADNTTSTCLFNWAEQTYPQFFAPAGSLSADYGPYHYRYYAATRNYLATSSTDNHVYVLGSAFGNTPADVGSAAGFLAQSGCTGIAQSYPGDVNIQNDPDVLFAEMGEQSALAELLARWDSSSSGNTVALDSTTWPTGSPGRQSIRLSTTGGTVSTAGLYKYFANSPETTIYARWYVKYNTVGTFHHSGPRLGGSSPPSSTSPKSIAGVRPTGADFFYLGAELSQGKTGPTNRSTVDFYNYWMHQRASSALPGSFYGNTFINSPNVAINTSEWNCIEVQLTLNDPVSGSNGAVAMWINGVEVSRVGPGTTGVWTDYNFRPDQAGQSFEGFQWRNDANLKWNYLQILHFADNDPAGLVNSVNYDHIVVARKYIGPIRPESNRVSGLPVHRNGANAPAAGQSSRNGNAKSSDARCKVSSARNEWSVQSVAAVRW